MTSVKELHDIHVALGDVCGSENCFRMPAPFSQMCIFHVHTQTAEQIHQETVQKDDWENLSDEEYWSKWGHAND